MAHRQTIRRRRKRSPHTEETTAMTRVSTLSSDWVEAAGDETARHVCAKIYEYYENKNN